MARRSTSPRSIGHGTVLSKVKGAVAGDLSPATDAAAKQIVDKAMRDGAVGMSTGLIYRPGTYSKTEEIIELQKVAAAYGGIYATHMRNEGTDILNAIDEALRIGREAGCRVEISHFKLPSDVAAKIGGADATLGKVAAARPRDRRSGSISIRTPPRARASPRCCRIRSSTRAPITPRSC